MEKPSLDYAFRFTTADLKENRHGRLSEAQAMLLRRDVLQLAVGIGGAVLAVTVLAVLSAQPAPGELSVIVLVVLIPVVLVLARSYFRTERALHPRTVKQVTSDLKLDQSPLSYGNNRVQMGDQVFTLSRTAYQALRSGAYTFYFVPTIQKIVAVEALERLPTDKPDQPAATIEAFDDDSRDILRA